MFHSFKIHFLFPFPCHVFCIPCGFNCTFTNEREACFRLHTNNCQSTQSSQSKAWISISKSVWMLVGVHNVHLCCLPVSTHFVSFTDHDVNSLLFVTNVTNLQTPLNVKAFASPLGTRNLTFIWELTKAKHGERIGCNGIVFGNLSLIFPIHIYRGRNSTHKKSCHKLAFFVKTVQLRFFISEPCTFSIYIFLLVEILGGNSYFLRKLWKELILAFSKHDHLPSRRLTGRL